MADEIKAVEQVASTVATDVKGFWKLVENWIATAWGKIEAFFQFLDGPNGKFSHKRLIAVACTVVALRQFIIKDWFAGVILLGAAVVLAVVSAITKT
jgi:hypothetical protein